MFNINIILCCDENYGIGKDNELLYHFKEDLIFFKETTNNKTVVMGRKTWESLPKKLPNRNNIVLTNSLLKSKPDIIFNNIEEILTLSLKEEIWIIGGASIYEQFMPYVSKILITKIYDKRENDTEVSFLKNYIHNFNLEKEISMNCLDKKTNRYIDISFQHYAKIAVSKLE